jgi:hypothetical protein
LYIPGAVLAAIVTLLFAGPAHAAVWDFSWLSTAIFFARGDTARVDREARGSATATITPDAAGNLHINFAMPAGLADVFVDRALQSRPDRQSFALGGVPMFFSPDGDLGILRGSAAGEYSFTGSFDDPDTFSLALRSGGSGPAGIQRFSGSGTRTAVAATEPTAMLLIGGALTGAAWVRRRVS